MKSSTSLTLAILYYYTGRAVGFIIAFDLHRIFHSSRKGNVTDWFRKQLLEPKISESDVCSKTSGKKRLEDAK